MSSKLRHGLVSAVALLGACAFALAACGGSGEDASSARAASDTGGADAQGSGAQGTGASNSASGGAAASGGKAGSGGTVGTGASASTGGGAGTGGEFGGGGGSKPSDGCAQPSTVTQGYEALDVEGKERSYYVIPAETDEPAPLFISFHGHSGTGEGDVPTFQLPNYTKGQAVLVYPQGVSQTWYDGGIGWDTRTNDSADVDFVKALIEETAANHCIDRSRIFAVGFSWGGWMATQVGCALGDQIRAVVSVAGGGPAGACQGPVSAFIMHGTADEAEPIAAGYDSRDKFIALNQCGTGTTPAGTGACVAYQGCVKPTWWWKHDSGHTFPAMGQDTAWTFLSSFL